MTKGILCRCIQCDNVFNHYIHGSDSPEHKPKPIACPKCGSIELERDEENGGIIMINRKQIASEYKEFVDTAEELSKRDLANYPLQKNEIERERFEKHLIGMIEMYDSKYGSISTIRARLETFKEISQWLSKHTEAEPIVLPDLEDYIHTNIKDLEKQLGAT